MSRTTRTIAAAGLALALAGTGISSAAPGEKEPGKAAKQKQSKKKFVRGARSLGDPLFPQIGNGGYDAGHYTIELDYDPATNVFNSARTTMVARARQNLSSFSMDFQALDVSRVTVNGLQARFRQREATPDLSDDDDVTQPMKLIVKPRGGLRKGRNFTVRVLYSGEPQLIVDADTSIEGWIQACREPRLRAALRRRPRRQPADRSAELVPVEQLPDRQGGLRHLRDGAERQHGVRDRRAGLAAQPRRQDDVALARGRPDRRPT